MKLSDYFNTLQHSTEDKKIDDAIVNTLRTSQTAIKSNYDPQWYYGALANNQYNFVFVPGVTGKICCGPVPNDYGVLSSGFSGCSMAMYTNYAHGNQRMGCHIWLAGKDSKEDCREDWNILIQNKSIGDCVVFRPDVDLLNKFPLESLSLWGLIEDRRCYSILVGFDDNGDAHLEYFCETPQISSIIK